MSLILINLKNTSNGEKKKRTFCQKRSFSARSPDLQDVLLQVDATLMSFKHVQAQQHVHRLFFKDAEGCCQMIVADLYLYHMYTTDYALYSNTFGDSSPPCVH